MAKINAARSSTTAAAFTAAVCRCAGPWALSAGGGGAGCRIELAAPYVLDWATHTWYRGDRDFVWYPPGSSELDPPPGFSRRHDDASSVAREPAGARAGPGAGDPGGRPHWWWWKALGQCRAVGR